MVGERTAWCILGSLGLLMAGCLDPIPPGPCGPGCPASATCEEHDSGVAVCRRADASIPVDAAADKDSAALDGSAPDDGGVDGALDAVEMAVDMSATDTSPTDAAVDTAPPDMAPSPTIVITPVMCEGAMPVMVTDCNMADDSTRATAGCPESAGEPQYVPLAGQLERVRCTCSYSHGPTMIASREIKGCFYSPCIANSGCARDLLCHIDRCTSVCDPFSNDDGWYLHNWRAIFYSDGRRQSACQCAQWGAACVSTVQGGGARLFHCRPTCADNESNIEECPTDTDCQQPENRTRRVQGRCDAQQPRDDDADDTRYCMPDDVTTRSAAWVDPTAAAAVACNTPLAMLPACPR